MKKADEFIKEYFSQLHIGDVVRHRNLTVAPIYGIEKNLDIVMYKDLNPADTEMDWEEPCN